MKRGLAVSQSGLCLGSSGSARIPACCSRHLAANVRQCMTSHPPDVEALMAEERKRMLSASPPDHPLRRHPTLTRLGLVQRWAVLEIPAGDQLRTEKGTSRWFLGGHPKTRAIGSFSSRRQLQGRWVDGDQRPVGECWGVSHLGVCGCGGKLRMPSAGWPAASVVVVDVRRHLFPRMRGLTCGKHPRAQGCPMAARVTALCGFV